MSTESPTGIDVFELDPAELTRSAINAVRTAFGVLGVLGIAFGIALMVWPGKTLVVGAAIIGIYFVMAGVVRLALGIFSRGISGGHRLLGILFGAVLLIGGVIALRNIHAATAVLVIITAVVVGIGWIIEGVMALVESGKASSRGLAIFYGVFSVIAGIIVLAVPGLSVVVFVTLTGALFLVLGIVGVVRAFSFGRGLEKAEA